MTPDVSVIIPTHQRPHSVGEAIKSALSQAGVTVEVFVLDDDAEGAARAAVEAIGDGRVRYVKREHPTGGRPAVVRNEGAAMARGRYLHFLDDDDRVAPGAYAAMTSALDAEPGKGVALGAVRPFGDDAAKVAHEAEYFADAAARARRAARIHSKRWLAANMLFRHALLVNSACMVRRELFARLGGYDESLDVVEDGDLFLRAIRRSGFVFVNRVVVEYRTGAPSLMSGATRAAVERAYEQIYAHYREEHGALELLALKALAKTALRWL